MSVEIGVSVDCIDCSCPGVVAQVLDPAKYATEEEVGLTVAK